MIRFIGTTIFFFCLVNSVWSQESSKTIVQTRNNERTHGKQTDIWFRHLTASNQNIIGPAFFDKSIFTKTFNVTENGAIINEFKTYRAHNPQAPEFLMPTDQLQIIGEDTTLIRQSTWIENGLNGTLRVEEKNVVMMLGYSSFTVRYYDVERIPVGESSMDVLKKLTVYSKSSADASEVFSYAIEYDYDTYFIPAINDLQVYYPEIRYYYSEDYELETGEIGRGMNQVTSTEHRNVSNNADSILFWRDFHYTVDGKDTTALAYASFSVFTYSSNSETDSVKQVLHSMEFSNPISDDFFDYDSRQHGFMYAPADYLNNPSGVFNRKVESITTYEPRVQGATYQEIITYRKPLEEAADVENELQLQNKLVITYDSFKKTEEYYMPENGNLELWSRQEQFYTYQNNTARVDSMTNYGRNNGVFLLSQVTQNLLDSTTKDSLVTVFGGNRGFVTVHEFSNNYPASLPIQNGETVSTQEISTSPYPFELAQNYPNPFNPSTTIRYSLPQAANVEFEVFNVLGQRVYVDSKPMQQAGYHQIQLNASNWASGIYFYRLSSENQMLTKKMLLLK